LIRLFVICPVQLKPGFIREEHTSPACQWPSKVNIFPLKSVTTLVRTTSTQMSFPETVSDSLCRNSSVSSAVRVVGLQTIPQVKKPDIEVKDWHGYT
jgi:hypothetical protein